MLSTLIQWSLSQRLLVLLLSILLLGFGGRALLNIPIDAFPDISPTQVKIIIKAPGMTPEEVDRNEKDRILQWRRDIAAAEENSERMGLQKKVTPFEKNLEVWRQLWRVVER